MLRRENPHPCRRLGKRDGAGLEHSASCTYVASAVSERIVRSMDSNYQRVVVIGGKPSCRVGTTIF
jgi:hypothetical protein